MKDQSRDIERKPSVLKIAEVPKGGENPHSTPSSSPEEKSMIPVEIIKAQNGIFDTIVETMKETDQTFLNSVNLAAILAANFDSSIGAAVTQMSKSVSLAITASSDLLKDLQNPIIPFPTIGLSEIATHYLSPTMQIADYLSPLIAEKNTEEKVGVILERSLKKPQVDIEKDLLRISQSQSDIIFNFRGYQFLFELEVFLRDLIHDRIIDPCKDSNKIQDNIPSTILEDWKSRKDIDEKNLIVGGSYRLIDYSDFTHLKMIFKKGRNWEKFKDLINEEQNDAVITKLDELDPIRKKIAHSRLLTEEEFKRLRMYSKDIQRLFKNS